MTRLTFKQAFAEAIVELAEEEEDWLEEHYVPKFLTADKPDSPALKALKQLFPFDDAVQ